MNREVAQSLAQRVEEIAKLYSREDRPNNFNAETFGVETVKVLSEHTAAVTFLKSSGKRAIAFFFFVPNGRTGWLHIFPTDSHLLGMQRFPELKETVEDANYPFNFSQRRDEVI